MRQTEPTFESRRLSKQGRAIPIMRVVYELSGSRSGGGKKNRFVFRDQKREHSTLCIVL